MAASPAPGTATSTGSRTAVRHRLSPRGSRPTGCGCGRASSRSSRARCRPAPRRRSELAEDCGPARLAASAARATPRAMNILLLGSGGREHALAWKIAASPLTARLWCAPGNAGIASEAECVPIDITDHQAVIAFCRSNKVEFVVVGPEAPLVAGIVDDLEGAGFKT